MQDKTGKIQLLGGEQIFKNENYNIILKFMGHPYQSNNYFKLRFMKKEEWYGSNSALILRDLEVEYCHKKTVFVPDKILVYKSGNDDTFIEMEVKELNKILKHNQINYGMIKIPFPQDLFSTKFEFMLKFSCWDPVDSTLIEFSKRFRLKNFNSYKFHTFFMVPSKM